MAYGVLMIGYTVDQSILSTTLPQPLITKSDFASGFGITIPGFITSFIRPTTTVFTLYSVSQLISLYYTLSTLLKPGIKLIIDFVPLRGC